MTQEKSSTFIETEIRADSHPGGASLAADKSYCGPVIHIDVEHHRTLISQLGGVFYIDVPDVARPHMEKLPISGLVDFVVDWTSDDQMPVVKTWKVKSGESTCPYFNGKECK